MGLKGKEIPLSARIVALADVYDALTTKRFYKEAYTHDKSKQIIFDLNASHFDPQVVDAFAVLEGDFKRIHEEKLKEEMDVAVQPVLAMRS